MSQLQPTLWRTCRIIASETRLHLLWLLFSEDSLCVADLAQAVGISDQNASTQLRAQSARGLITPVRKKLKVFYHPEVNTDVAHAETLLDALHLCFKTKIPTTTIIRQATAFTHIRRIEIVRALNRTPLSFEELNIATHISPTALSNHLNKLSARNFIKLTNGVYRLQTPRNSFGRVLMDVSKS